MATQKIVNVTTLGSFELQVDGKELTDEINRSQKLWNILCYLILHRDRQISQSEFITLFWQEENSANPANALKTLLYRVRTLLEPLFEPGAEPILSQRGSYSWNRDLLCTVDIDEFETLCHKAADLTLPISQRLALYREATALYRGDFLPKLANQMWVVPISARYHALYLHTVKIYAQLLEEVHDYTTLAELAYHASQLDPLEEDLHILIVRSLLRQGKEVAALEHYTKATDLLYRNLGVTPSQELQALYREIMATEKTLETDLTVIQKTLKETAARPGAFVCEYGFFKEIYRLEARRAVRSGICVQVILLTVSLPDGNQPALQVVNNTMDQLLAVLMQNLRRGDVIAKYSSAQYVALLPSANFEDSTMVMDRVVATFYRLHRRNFLKISYRIREMDLAE